MKAAMRQVAEINRLKEAKSKTTSKYLISDYTKGIKRLEDELKEYCFYRGLSYEEIIKSEIKNKCAV